MNEMAIRDSIKLWGKKFNYSSHGFSDDIDSDSQVFKTRSLEV
jgi:hypothetical protein